MVLAIHYDASYLSENNARSRAGGQHFLSHDEENHPNNGAVFNLSTIIRNVISSASEAELGALFLNSKTEVPMCKTLEDLGHPQPRTPIQTDNKTADGLTNNKIILKATKSIGMKFHWLQCRDNLDQFRFFWRPGHTILRDYLTKHHTGAHYKSFRQAIITSRKFLDTMHAYIK